MLDACHIEEGTEEEEWEGAARMYLQQYLSETGFIPSIEDQRIQDQRRPMVIGRQDHGLRGRPPGVRQQDHVPGALGQGRGRHARRRSARRACGIRGTRFKEQSRWVLPEEFDPADYSANKEAQP